MGVIPEMEGGAPLPGAQVRLEIFQSESRQNERLTQIVTGHQTDIHKLEKGMGDRFIGIETRLSALEGRMTQVEQSTKNILDSLNSVAESVKEIKVLIASTQMTVHTVETETAEGVKVVQTVSRWKQTAEDFHLQKLLRWGIVVGASWTVAHLIGWLFGPEIRDRVVHAMFGEAPKLVGK